MAFGIIYIGILSVKLRDAARAQDTFILYSSRDHISTVLVYTRALRRVSQRETKRFLPLNAKPLSVNQRRENTKKIRLYEKEWRVHDETVD